MLILCLKAKKGCRKIVVKYRTSLQHPFSWYEVEIFYSITSTIGGVGYSAPFKKSPFATASFTTAIGML